MTNELDLAERVQRLEARLAIQELVGDFGRAIDEWSERAMREVLAEDVVIHRAHGLPAVSGVDTAISIMRELQRSVRSIQHFICNVRVELSSNSHQATVRAYIFAVRDHGSALSQRGGAYRMAVSRCNSARGWRISAMDVTETWSSPEP